LNFYHVRLTNPLLPSQKLKDLLEKNVVLGLEQLLALVRTEKAKNPNYFCFNINVINQ